MSLFVVVLASFVLLRSALFAARYVVGSTRFEVGFFHPYAAGGGGGERVLWFAIEELLTSRPDVDVVVFHGHRDATDSEILNSALVTFGVSFENLKSRISFVRLRFRDSLLRPRKRLTMLLQYVGGGLLALEAVVRRPVDVFIDSTGHPASGLVVFALVGKASGWTPFFASIPIITYTHYPTISKDMMQLVVERRPAYNNSVSNSRALSTAKILYYRAFAWMYWLSGTVVTLAMCNSRWTAAHVEQMFCARTTVVHPPCGTTPRSDSAELCDDNNAVRKVVVLSVGQFRVEKDHRKQLRALPTKSALPKDFPRLKLVMVGGVRNAEDAAYVEELRDYATTQLNLVENSDFEFLVNASRVELEARLCDPELLCGIHTMWNEHFGIGVVELMRHTVVVAHNSGGPKFDIVTPERDGFLATTAEEYRAFIVRIAAFQSASDRAAMRAAALNKAREFDDEEFKGKFSRAMERVLPR